MYIFGIRTVTSSDNVAIIFLPCLVGTFTLQVESNGEEIQNSPLAFSVETGSSAHLQHIIYFSIMFNNW